MKSTLVGAFSTMVSSQAQPKSHNNENLLTNDLLDLRHHNGRALEKYISKILFETEYLEPSHATILASQF